MELAALIFSILNFGGIVLLIFDRITNSDLDAPPPPLAPKVHRGKFNPKIVNEIRAEENLTRGDRWQ